VFSHLGYTEHRRDLFVITGERTDKRTDILRQHSRHAQHRAFRHC